MKHSVVHHLAKIPVTLRYRRFQVALFVIVWLAYLAFKFNLGDSPARLRAWDTFDTMLKLGTLVFAVFVWINESHQALEESLDKRLYVIFRYRKQPLLRCDHAPLFGEGDIRAFSQQIGAQMAGGRNLNFAPGLRRSVVTVRLDAPAQSVFRGYFVEFDLDEKEPFAASTRPIKNAPDEQALHAARTCRYWRADRDATWSECSLDDPALKFWPPHTTNA